MPHYEDDDDMKEDVLYAVKKYGLATIAAIVFGYIVIVDVRADQSRMEQTQRAILDQLIAIVEEQGNLARGVLKVADKNGETQMLQEKILGVMQVMCLQGTTSQQERRDCLRGQ